MAVLRDYLSVHNYSKSMHKKKTKLILRLQRRRICRSQVIVVTRRLGREVEVEAVEAPMGLASR